MHPSAIYYEKLAEELQATGNYRVLRRINRAVVSNAHNSGFPLKGIVIDTETTGLTANDEIIEIAAIAFNFDSHGNVGEVTGVYSGLSKPKRPIPADITQITGITAEMVEGQRIDIQQLDGLIEPADLIIAHNAGFDRPFCEKLSKAFSIKPWACSVAEIDWAARGVEGTKLSYIVAQAGFYYSGHRALDDCCALFEILKRKSDSQVNTPLAELYNSSLHVRVRVWAQNSPFSMKEKLKSRKYKWSDGSDGKPKAWWLDVAESSLNVEIEYLRDEIYNRSDINLPTERLTAADRYKTRLSK